MASKVLEALGENTPFSLKQILVELEGGSYVGPIRPGPLAELLAGRRPAGGGGNGGGGSGGGISSSDRGVGGVKRGKGWLPWRGAQGCGCDTMRNCAHFHFGKGRTNIPY